MLLGGWQWNATMIVGSGIPFSPSYNECNSDRDTGPCRPNLTGGFHMSSGSFNPGTQTRTGVRCLLHSGRPVSRRIGQQSGAFSRPQVGTFGNIHRNQFTGPGEFMSDMSIFKNFSITESVKAQFQAEFFNVFNHPVYNTSWQHLY